VTLIFIETDSIQKFKITARYYLREILTQFYYDCYEKVSLLFVCTM